MNYLGDLSSDPQRFVVTVITIGLLPAAVIWIVPRWRPMLRRYLAVFAGIVVIVTIAAFLWTWLAPSSPPASASDGTYVGYLYIETDPFDAADVPAFVVPYGLGIATAVLIIWLRRKRAS
jgi:hypothetical protein